MEEGLKVIEKVSTDKRRVMRDGPAFQYGSRDSEI